MDEPRGNFDPELQKQFSRIVISLFLGLLFLIINAYLGVVLDLGFQDNKSIPQWQHICFYIWFLFSFYALVRILLRLWNR